MGDSRVERMMSKVVVYPAPVDAEVERAADLVYRVVDRVSMTLDVYRPANAAARLPAAVFIHGDLAEAELVRDIKKLGSVPLVGRADRLEWDRRLRLLDSTPVPCAASRETVRRSRLAGYAAYGYCRSHHRCFWGFRLYLLCAPDGLPVGFELAPANAPERAVGAELLERTLAPGQTVIADKGFSGAAFEQLVASLGGRLLRPDRRDEPHRYGSLGGIRQWIESAFATCKGQLSLERHGGRTLTGVVSRITCRLLALTAAILHNQLSGLPARSLVAYDH